MFCAAGRFSLKDMIYGPMDDRPLGHRSRPFAWLVSGLLASHKVTGTELLRSSGNFPLTLSPDLDFGRSAKTISFTGQAKRANLYSADISLVNGSGGFGCEVVKFQKATPIVQAPCRPASQELPDWLSMVLHRLRTELELNQPKIQNLHTALVTITFPGFRSR